MELNKKSSVALISCGIALVCLAWTELERRKLLFRIWFPHCFAKGN